MQAAQPKKPTDSNPGTLKVYEAKLKTYKKQKEKIDSALRDYTEKMAELRPQPGAMRELPEGAEKLITETFLRTVSRYPTHKEMEMARTDLVKAPNVVAGVQELLLALLNTKEFMVNH